MSTWPTQAECTAFYGNPSGSNGKPNPGWERANLVSVPLPWKAFASWDAAISIKSVRMHRKVEASLRAVLGEIWDGFGRRQAEVELARMHLVGGGYNFRLMRGGSRLSMHAYGCAVDFDPAMNGLGDTTPAMNRLVVAIFEKAGWTWGGRWSGGRCDGMHFQAARVE